jgi:hypothetical protein
MTTEGNAMKRIRHRLGHWLLRDAPDIHHVSAAVSGGTVQVYMDGKALHDTLLRLKRERGGGSLGLS